ncbi:hypothetical protein LCGC14_2366140, partial [marine sediment metagenome]
MNIKLYSCGKDIGYSTYQLGLGYLKTNCSTKEHCVSIVNNSKDLHSCDLIGLSSNAWSIREAINIVKTSKIPVIIGGQATLWDKLKNYSFRHIIVGEGEVALLNILNNTVTYKTINSSLIQDIDTLKFPDRGKLKNKSIPILSSRG